MQPITFRLISGSLHDESNVLLIVLPLLPAKAVVSCREARLRARARELYLQATLTQPLTAEGAPDRRRCRPRRKGAHFCGPDRAFERSTRKRTSRAAERSMYLDSENSADENAGATVGRVPVHTSKTVYCWHFWKTEGGSWADGPAAAGAAMACMRAAS